MIVKFHPGKHSFRNGASNAFVPTNTKNHPNRGCGSGVFFCLLRLPPQTPANKNVLDNDPLGHPLD